MIIYLDLDRTLYDTVKGNEHIWHELEKLYGIDSKKQRARQSDFYIWQDEKTYYYDIAAHMRDVRIDPADANVKLIRALEGDSFLMPGAKDFLERVCTFSVPVELLTYGDTYFQTLKASLCTALHGVPLRITRRPKHVFLETQRECVLVDDKPIVKELPAHVHFFHVQLEQKKHFEKDIYSYTDLVAVSRDIEAILTK